MSVHKKMGPKGPWKYTAEVIEKFADKLDEWITIPTNFWLGDFAVDVCNCDLVQLERFAASNEKFCCTYKKAKQIQTNRIVKLAMGKKIDCAMAIFSLKNVAGWRDNKEPFVIDQSKHTHKTYVKLEKMADGELLENLLNRRKTVETKFDR